MRCFQIFCLGIFFSVGVLGADNFQNCMRSPEKEQTHDRSRIEHILVQKNENSSTVKKALCIGVGLGAATSFAIWIRPTMSYIRDRGIVSAIISTHIPRLILDVGTVALCFLSYPACSK